MFESNESMMQVKVRMEYEIHFRQQQKTYSQQYQQQGKSIMSAYQHRRNFSLLTTQSQTTNKLKSINRSLRKIQTNNNYSWLLIAAKQYYHKTNNLQAAINNFQEYLTHYPNHQQSLYLCAICYMNIQQYYKAIQKLKQYLNAKKANNPTTLNNRKLIITSQGQLPNISHAFLLLSMAFNKLNNLTKSMETINESIKQDNKFEQGFCFRAKLYQKMGENQKAFYDYKQVLKYNHRCWEAWVGLGDYYSQANNYQQALKCYEKAKEYLQLQNKGNRTGSSDNQAEKSIQERYETRKSSQKTNELLTSKAFQKMQHKKNSKINERLQQFLKKPKQLNDVPIVRQQEQNQKPLAKLHWRSVTSPSNQTNIQNLISQTQKQNIIFQSQKSNYDPLSNIPAQTRQEIDLKISTSLYFLGENTKSIAILQVLLTNKATNYYSQIYFYLAMNQLKLYEQQRSNKNSKSMNQSHFQDAMSKKNRKEINKIHDASILVELSSATPTNASELLHQAILNLESSIRSNNNKKVMTKATKTLIKLYIQNNQFYQTSAILQLAEKYQLDIKEYRILSEVCMLVIKQKYQQALPILKRLYQSISNQHPVSPKRSDINAGERISGLNIEKLKEKEKIIDKEHQKCQSMRLSINGGKIAGSSKKNKMSEFEFQEQHIKDSRQALISSTGNDRKSNRHKNLSIKDQLEQKLDHNFNQFKNLTIKNKISPKGDLNLVQSSSPQIMNSNQFQWMIPIVLLFRAYSQYFSDNFIECLQIYEHYENYIKDYLGREPENDVYLSFNKIMCEGILMLDNEMIEESLEKFVLCVENYYRLLKGVAVEPILFRILGMIRLAISQNAFLSQEVNSRNKIFILIIEVLDHYMPAILNCPLVYYYYAIALYQLERYKQASDYLEKCLKIAEECTWKYLYVKGVVEIKNRLYKEAIREFSAGLLVEEKAEIYLGRCICYIQLFEQSEGEQQVLMEKSFEDLQKFIELQDNKEKISKWVTKILFFNKAYQQVTKSIKKVSSQALESDEDMLKIQKCLNIYNGIFEDGGVLGQVLINAFEGKFQESSVEINQQRHQIVLSDFVNSKYKKWLNILNLYSAEKYPELIKYLQMAIFEQKNEEEAVQLRYNLAIVYYLSEEISKADNVIASLPKYLPEIATKVEKFINKEFYQDECVDDLQSQLKGIKRLSSFLPYRRILLSTKFPFEAAKSIYVKISLPFPQFFKPDIDLTLEDTFLYGQTAQTCIPKKIEAPWIKKVTGNVQFTDNVVESHNSSLFDQDVLTPESQSKQQSVSVKSLKL